MFLNRREFLSPGPASAAPDQTLELTIDRWESADAHRSFRSAFAQEYAVLDARCQHLTAQEVLLGAFDEAAAHTTARREP